MVVILHLRDKKRIVIIVVIIIKSYCKNRIVKSYIRKAYSVRRTYIETIATGIWERNVYGRLWLTMDVCGSMLGCEVVRRTMYALRCWGRGWSRRDSKTVSSALEKSRSIARNDARNRDIFGYFRFLLKLSF